MSDTFELKDREYLESLSDEELLALKENNGNKLSSLSNAEKALKKLINSVYGGTAFPSFIFYNIALAKSTTAYGRSLIKATDDYVNAFIKSRYGEYYKGKNKFPMTDSKNKTIGVFCQDNPLIYNHTDSAYFELGSVINAIHSDKSEDEKYDIAEKLGNEILEGINKVAFKNVAYYYNCVYLDRMVMEFEKIADKGIFATKANYLYRPIMLDGYHVPKNKRKVEVTGLSIKASSTCNFTSNKVLNNLNLFLDKNYKEVMKFVEEAKEEFKKAKIEDLCSAVNLNKMLQFDADDYDTCLFKSELRTKLSGFKGKLEKVVQRDCQGLIDDILANIRNMNYDEKLLIEQCNRIVRKCKKPKDTFELDDLLNMVKESKEVIKGGIFYEIPTSSMYTPMPKKLKTPRQLIKSVENCCLPKGMSNNTKAAQCRNILISKIDKTDELAKMGDKINMIALSVPNPFFNYKFAAIKDKKDIEVYRPYISKEDQFDKAFIKKIDEFYKIKDKILDYTPSRTFF